MTLFRSWAGIALSAVYTAGTVFMAQDEIRHSAGGWINLRGLGTNLLTAPSQVLLGPVLKLFGVPRINYTDPGPSSYAQLTLHIAVTAAFIYLLGWGGEWVVRRAIGRL